MSNAYWGNRVAAGARGNFSRFSRPMGGGMTPGAAQPGGLSAPMAAPRAPGRPISLSASMGSAGGGIPTTGDTLSGPPPNAIGPGGSIPTTGNHSGSYAGLSSSPSAPSPPNGGMEQFAMEDGGVIPEDDNGGIPNRQGGEDHQTLQISNALEAVDNAMRWGYQKMGIGGGQQQDQAQGFDDGGEVDDESSPTEAIPTQEPLEGDQTDQTNAMQTPTQQPQQDANGNPAKLVGLVQGAGAMPTSDAVALMRQTGEEDPDLAKLKVAEQLQDKPDQLWAFMQSLRQHFNIERAAAAVKTQGGHIDAALQTGEEMLSNVLDGTYTTLKKTAEGVLATVHKVDDDRPISATTLSPEAWYGFITGPEGGYDQIHNNSVANILSKLSKAGNGAPPDLMQSQNTGGAGAGQKPGTPPAGQQPDFLTNLARSAGSAMTAGYRGGTDEAEATPAAAPQPSPQAGGTTPAAPPTNRPAQVTPRWPGDPSAQQRVMSAQTALGVKPRAKPQAEDEEDPYALPPATERRLQQEANNRFGTWASTKDARGEWMDKRRSEILGIKNKTDVADINAGAKVDVQQARNEGSASRESIRAAATDRRTNAQLQAALAGVNARLYSTDVMAATNYLRSRLNQIANGGTALTPKEEAGAAELINQLGIAKSMRGASTSQSDDETPAPAPAKPQGGKRPPPGWVPVRTDQVNTGLQ